MNSGLSHKGRSWDSPIEPVFETTSGDFATAKELFQRGMPNSKLSRTPVGMRFLRRVHHEHTIEVDEHGWAFCPVCNQVFNCDYKDDDRPTVQEIGVGYSRDIDASKAPPPEKGQSPNRSRRSWRGTFACNP